MVTAWHILKNQWMTVKKVKITQIGSNFRTHTQEDSDILLSMAFDHYLFCIENDRWQF